MKKWGFIDYENLPQAVGKAQQLGFDRLYIFVGAGQKNSNLTASKKQIITQIKRLGPNNLDFHLAYYLGLANQRADKETEFVIFTKDTGLDELIEHLKERGRVCRRQD